MLKKLNQKLDSLRHPINPLHVYCRLVEWNIMSIKKAKIISKVYDKLFYRILYPLERGRDL